MTCPFFLITNMFSRYLKAIKFIVNLSFVMIDIILWFVHSIDFYLYSWRVNFRFMHAIHGIDEKLK